MNREEWETELIHRIRQGHEVKNTGKLTTYCGVTWADIMENPYCVTTPQDTETN